MTRLPALALLTALVVAGCTALSPTPVEQTAAPAEDAPAAVVEPPAEEPAPAPSPPPTPTPAAAPEPTPPSLAAPPPDRVLETILMRYPSEGTRAPERSFVVPTGATRLSFVVYLNATEAGPYTATSVVCMCSTGLELYAPSDDDYEPTWRRPWGAIDQKPLAGQAAGPEVVDGPYEVALTAPQPGEWTLVLSGTGENLEASFTARLSFA